MQAIYRLELGYQRGNLRLHNGFLRRLGYAGLVIGLVAAFYIIFLEAGLGLYLLRTLALAAPEMRQATFTLFFAIPITILAPTAIIFHFYTLIRTLIYASSAITREKEQGTWDALVLTRLNAWQILLGKAWATAIHLFPTYFLLAIIRYATILCWSMTEARSYDSFAVHLYWFQSDSMTGDQIILIAMSVWVFTLANLPLTVAFGLLGGLLNWKIAIPFAFVLRAAVVGLTGLLMIAGGTIFLDLFAPHAEMITMQDANGNVIGTYHPDMPQLDTLEYYAGSTLINVGQTMLDNGVMLHYRWAKTGNNYFISLDGSPSPMFSGYALLASLVAYVLITAAVLFTAQRVALRQGSI